MGFQGAELSKVGRKRAKALPHLFLKHPDLQKPVALFAKKPKNKNGSIRAIRTLNPLSKELNLPVQIPYDCDRYHLLIEMIKNDRKLDGKTVLISWGHDELESFAEGFGAKNVKHWDSKVYDHFWLLTFKNNEFVSFEDRAQKVIK
ncbi:MAG: hypothetical protein ACXWC9_02800 [Pseudobdellovibrionaceae bacterium]